MSGNFDRGADMSDTPNTKEIPLAGGNTNAQVVRVGDTVRRAMTASSPTIHRFLKHLRDNGFDAAPEFLGVDDKGRETLSFIDGGAASNEELWGDQVALVSSARMLRKFHDATLGFDTAGAIWAKPDPELMGDQVICHNDFAPYNLIYADGVAVGVIDFDLVGPAPRMRDLAYLAYWCVPMSLNADDMKGYAARDLAAGSPRLKLICEAYGAACDEALLDMVAYVLAHMADDQAMIDSVGEVAAQRLIDGGHLDHWAQETLVFKANQSRFLANL